MSLFSCESTSASLSPAFPPSLLTSIIALYAASAMEYTWGGNGPAVLSPCAVSSP